MDGIYQMKLEQVREHEQVREQGWVRVREREWVQERVRERKDHPGGVMGDAGAVHSARSLAYT